MNEPEAEQEQQLLDSKILIVDDEKVNVILLEQTLETEGYENIHSTCDPTQVLPLCIKNAFDLILLDIRMPKMDGFEVVAALGEVMRDNYLPIIVLTAQTDEETRAKALGAGVNDFITKPFKRWEVLLRIRNMLTSRRYFKRQQLRTIDLEEKVHERTQEIRKTQLKIIQRLGRAGEYRDNETGTHVIRMSKSSQLLALAAGLGEIHAEKI